MPRSLTTPTPARHRATRRPPDRTTSPRRRAARGATAAGGPGARRWAGIVPLFLAVLLAPARAADAQRTGWQEIDLPETGGTAVRYVPPDLDPAEPPLPLVVFLHGAGGRPQHYRGFLLAAAGTTRVALVVPKSSTDLGWGVGDDAERVREAVTEVGKAFPIDPARTGISGHSAGGAFALLLGLAPDSPYNAIFQMSSPFVPVAALPGRWTPPLRQYYGTEDPNYLAAYPLYTAQWSGLGLAVSDQIEPGYGHSTWPPGTLEAGFQLLRDTVRPEETLPGSEPVPPDPCADDTVLCLHGGRFEVRARWTDGSGSPGEARTVPLRTDDSGLLWFFDPDNWEVMVKVLDGCTVNGHFWVFAAASTDVAYELEVTDTATGATRSWANTGGVAAPAITATDAFPTCGPTG